MLGSGIAAAARADGSPAAAIPLFRPHLMQGWSPDFIPKLTEDALATGLIDRIVPIDGADAMRCARELARKEGIFVGISARRDVRRARCRSRASAPAGANILCMLPDTGERYLSTPLFADIPAEMTDGGARDLALDAELPLRRAPAPAPRRRPPSPAAAPWTPRRQRSSRLIDDRATTPS